MDWKKFIIYPVAIYVVIYLFICVLVGMKVPTNATWVWIVTLLITIIGLYLATRYAKPKNIKEGLYYGLVWLAIFFVLDLILTRPFTGWAYFSSWKTWLVYALALLMPVLLPKSKR